MIIEQIRDFHTDHIFDCGQCFRWDREEDGSYTGIAGDRPANISFEEGILRIDAPGIEGGDEEEEAFWRDYLDLDRDYGKIKKHLARRDPILKEAISYGEGIRILRQDPWEALVSFIISSNNNIPRIKKNIRDLAEGFGRPAGEFRGQMFYTLPSPQVLAALTKEDLAPCRLGYRGGYLIKTAAMVEAAGEVTFDDLLSYSGVGPKVADCIALFSMGRYERFPIDTWVEKVMRELYGLENKRAMASFAAETFGRWGGIAQQYLFHYMRYHRK